MALKVLLADDSVPAQNMGKKILTDAGYEVLAVSNGLEALRKIADHMPDLAILDIFMPGYSGLEVCARLRAASVTADLPVILTVGKLEPYRPEDGEQVRSNAVIVKPFAANELVSAVRSLVGSPFGTSRNAAAQPEPASEVHETAAPAPDEPPEPAEVAASLPESFAFDPGARRTAFRASAIEEHESLQPGSESAYPSEAECPQPEPESAYPAELVEPEPDAPALAESEADVFTDFALEPSASSPDAGLAPAPAPDPAPALVEWWHASPESAAPAEAAPEPLSSAAIEEPEAANPIPAEPSAAETPLAAQAAEPESVVNGVPAVESWPEVPFAASSLAVGEAAAPEPEATPFGERAESAAECPAPEVLAAEADALPQGAAAQPDREARMRAFEELFHADVPFPLEGNSAALASSDAQPRESLQSGLQSELQSESCQSAPEVNVESPDELELCAPAVIEGGEADGFGDSAEAIADETSPASELQLDAASLADWLSTGKVPRDAREAPPAAHPSLATPAEAEPAPEPATETEEAPELAQPEAVAANMSMVCYLAKEHATSQRGPGASARNYLPAEANGAALIEMAYSGVEPVQSASEAPQQSEPLPSAAEEVAPAEFACAVLEPQANVLQDDVFETEGEAGQPAEEFASAEPCTEPEVCEPYSPEPEAGELYLPEAGATEADGAYFEGSEPAAVEPRNEAERIQEAVQNVFERFRPLLVAAIVRELARLD